MMSFKNILPALENFGLLNQRLTRWQVLKRFSFFQSFSMRYTSVKLSFLNTACTVSIFFRNPHVSAASINTIKADSRGASKWLRSTRVCSQTWSLLRPKPPTNHSQHSYWTFLAGIIAVSDSTPHIKKQTNKQNSSKSNINLSVSIKCSLIFPDFGCGWFFLWTEEKALHYKPMHICQSCHMCNFLEDRARVFHCGSVFVCPQHKYCPGLEAESEAWLLRHLYTADILPGWLSTKYLLIIVVSNLIWEMSKEKKMIS